MIGVSFQPGQGYGNDPQNSNGSPAPSQGVQEAIKVLSLRLPKVVGAQAMSPLMSAPAMGGGRVESVVNSVLARMFPGSGMPQMGAPQNFGMAPSAGGDVPSAPSFNGGLGPNPLMQMRREAPSVDTTDFLKPRVVADLPPTAPPEAPFTGGPPRYPNAPTPDGGSGMPPAMIAPLPKMPDFPKFSDYPAFPEPNRDALI